MKRALLLFFSFANHCFNKIFETDIFFIDKLKGMSLKLRLLFFFFFVLAVFPIMVNAQMFEEFDVDKEDASDEKTELKIINPKVGSWKISDYGTFQDSIVLDTALDNFQNYHLVFQNSLTATYLGNYGLPAIDNDFFNRNHDVDFLFSQTREFYMLTPAKLQYYNTHTPYTRLDFSQSENMVIKNETRFNVFHSQNVNPDLNFTFRINLSKSAGQYTAQDSRNNFITLYSSYTGQNLRLFSGFITNGAKNSENGGLTNEQDIFNGAETELLNVNLNASKSLFKSTYYFVNGEYRFGKMIKTEGDSVPTLFRPILGIVFNSQYERHRQEFIDEEVAENTFFENTYFGEDYTKDSIRFNRLSNVFQLKQYENSQRKYSFGKRAFIGFDLDKTLSPGADTAIITSIVNNYTNVYAGGGIFRETGSFWNWKFDGKIVFAGAKAGETELRGLITKPFRVANDSTAALVISGNINNTAADYFQNEFYSNHYRWNNDFKMQQRMNVNGSIVSQTQKLRLSANYALINNYIFFNREGIPEQTGKELLVLSAFADKDFALKNFHFHARALWQQVSDENYIHLPDFSAFVSAYYKFVISKVLFTQIGVDTRYNTKYYADAYSPSTGLFYLQSEKKYGNYPYIDIYANLRLKRTRAFFKLSNIGTNFLDGEYFTSPGYPMPRSTFRFGLSWLFYD